VLENAKNLDLLMNVSLGVTAELGRASLTLRQVLELGTGSLVELDRLAGGAIDLYVNERLVARGEIVAVDEKYGVRVTEVLARATPRP